MTRNRAVLLVSALVLIAVVVIVLTQVLGDDNEIAPVEIFISP